MCVHACVYYTRKYTWQMDVSDDDFTAGTSYRRSHNELNISAKSLSSVVQSLADRLTNAFGIYV